MAAIVLSTLNARYTHASLGLRYLRANLGAYRGQTEIVEFTIKRPPAEIVETVLGFNPRVVGFGVYIWNTDQTLAVVKLLKERRPDLMVVLGGPEISFEAEGQELTEFADYVFQGEGEKIFSSFIETWFARGELPATKIVRADLPEVKALQFPYDEYTDEDIAHRTLYVEASRGCPYKCEYCLSSLDVSVRAFDIEAFLAQMDRLIGRGARQFKFVDRTFNLSPTVSGKILRFFLDRVDRGLFLHFEMVPDRLGDDLKELIKQFPAGALQFEIGVQTWNPTVARNVSRRQNYDKIVENFNFLRSETGVHTHSDLIVGLPGETRESFAAGFDALFALQPDEIQVGILKRLKGTPIARHDDKFAMRYAPAAPFEIQSNRDLNAAELSGLKVFAEFWDLLANSGRFPRLRELWSQQDKTPFTFFDEMAQALHRHFGRTHSIHLRDLEAAVQQYLIDHGWAPEFGVSLQKSSHHSAPERQSLHLHA